MTGITGSKLGITLAAMSAALMAILDISIVNVALSDIRASFGTPIDQIAWVSTGYMMANVVVMPMTGWLQRRFGYRRYFTASILIFIVASALCGMAWSLPSLVAFRILQGIGGGAIIPTAQSILFTRYPREEHGMAGALFGIGAMTGPLLGPTVGGYLIEVSSWQWIFLINVPIGLFAAYMAWRHIEEPGFVAPKDPVDARGIGLLAVGMGALQYVLEEGHRHDWLASTTIGVLAAIAVVALVTFIVHELETPNPVVDFRVFANRSYAAATGVNFLIGTALFSGGFMFSLYCGAIMHYRAFDIGILFLKGSAIQLALMPLIGKFGGKLDQRLLVGAGVALVAYSLWLNGHLSTQSDELAMLTPIFFRAVGLCCIFIPLGTVALSDLPAAKRGNATGLFNLTRELGGSIGTAWMSSLLAHRSVTAYSYMAEGVSNFNSATAEQLARMQQSLGWRFFNPEAGALTLLQGRLSQQALIRAFNENFTILAALFVGALALVLLLKRPRGGATAGGAH